jgi:hypothetical protein
MLCSGLRCCALLCLTFAASARADLIHYYTFEESTGAAVDSGTNNTSVPLLNGTTRVSGGVNATSLQALQTGIVDGTGNDFKAAVFNGSGVSSMTGTAGISGLTISTWVNPSSFNGSGATVNTIVSILRGGSGTTNQARAALAIYANGGIRFGGRKLDADTFQSVNSTANGLVALNTWTHIAAVVNYDVATGQNGTVQLYVNGLPVGTSALSGAWATDLATSSTNSAGLILGSNNPAAATDSEPFNGRIDNLRIYNEALNSAAVLGLYQAEVIPEPGMIALAMLGVAGAVGWKVRRRVAA